MHHRLQQLFLAVCLAFCISAPARAADQDGQEKPPPPTLRHIYDVTELVRAPLVDADTSAVMPPTELAPRRPQSGSGNGPPRTEPNPLQSRLEELSKLIEAEIDPGSWGDNGGSEGGIRAYDTQLIITASAPNHAQIAEMLAELQKRAGRCVRLRATWVALSEEELRSALEPIPAKGEVTAGARILDLSVVERIKGGVRYRAEVNTLNGQRVNVTAGRARSILTDLEAVVGNSAVGMQPTIDLVLAGAALQVRPILSADSTAVTLDLRAVVSGWNPADAPPLKVPQPVASSQPAGSVPPPPVTHAAPPLEIERLNMPVQLLATAVKIPTGRAVLIGGMTADHGTPEDRRPLYLIIEAWASKPKS
jgi:type II secretory pathway component GspD/PulD (secretin)